MGCCVSTNKSSSPKNHSSFKNRAPPQSFPLLEIEEETVKEVLSETPATKPKIPEPTNPIRIPPNSSKIREEKNDIVDKIPAIINPFDVPDVSEICSNLNQRMSPMTTGSMDNGEFRRRVERSPSKNRNQSFSSDMKSQRETGKSPARRSEPSPGRVRSTRERRGDAGESSGRRTMSPVRYTDGGSTRFDLGRSPSVRRTGKSPCHVRSNLPEKNRKVEEGMWPPTANESLENPLVSLECFIFL